MSILLQPENNNVTNNINANVNLKPIYQTLQIGTPAENALIQLFFQSELITTYCSCKH